MDAGTIRQLWAYTDWADDVVLDLAERVPAGEVDVPRGAGHGTIRQTLAHVLVSQQVWLRRWRGESAWSEFPADPDLVELRRRWRAHRAEMAAFLAELTPERLAAPVHYRNTTGAEFTQALWQLMLQPVIHGAHHRSEVAEMLTELGHPPPPMDWVHYLRSG